MFRSVWSYPASAATLPQQTNLLHAVLHWSYKRNHQTFLLHAASYKQYAQLKLPLHACRPERLVRYPQRYRNHPLLMLHRSYRRLPQDVHPLHCPQSRRSGDSILCAKHFRYTFPVFFLPPQALRERKYCSRHSRLFLPFLSSLSC